MSEKEIADALPSEEINQAVLKEILKDYANPNARIAQLARKGVIRRVKRGWYVRGEAYRKRPWSRHYLANVLYTPSYVSLESALAHYGLIPERVESLTSVTTSAPRSFDTFLGRFTYRHIPGDAFREGLDLAGGQRGQPSFFIATPEKALADLIQHARRHTPTSDTEWTSLLLDDLRLDEEGLLTLDTVALEIIATAYRSRKLTDLAGYLYRWRQQS